MNLSSNHIPPHLLPLMPESERKRLGKAGLTVAEAVAIADDKAELDLQGDIAGYLRLHEVEYIKPDGRKRSPLPKGWTDFTFAYRGVPVAMEVKTATGKLSVDQENLHPKLAANGWRVGIVRSVTDVQALLRSIDVERATGPAWEEPTRG